MSVHYEVNKAAHPHGFYNDWYEIDVNGRRNFVTFPTQEKAEEALHDYIRTMENIRNYDESNINDFYIVRYPDRVLVKNGSDMI